MIKHVSVFTLKDKTEIKKMVMMLTKVQNSCPLVVDGEIGLNFAEKKEGPGPEWGDIIQILRFNTKEDLEAYPATEEHMWLIKEGPEMEKVTAIDYYAE